MPVARSITAAEKAAGHELHRDLQMVMGGHPVGPCVIAMTNSMSALVAYVSDTPAAADRFIDKLAIDLKEEVRLNWDYIQTIKAQANQPGHG